MKSRKFNDNWKEYVLYDLANWKNGLAFNKINFSEDGYPIIKIAELKNGITSQTNFTKDKCSEEVYLRKNDLIFSWSGNPETSIDAYLYDLPEGYLNQHSFKVTPYEFINKYFLFYILKYLKPIFKKIASNKQTTGLGHITISDLRNLKIKIPTIEIQEKFLKIIKRIDDKIKLNNQTNDNLLKIGLELLKEDFNQKTEYEVLSNAIKFVKGKKPLDITPKVKEGYKKYLTIACLNGQEVNYADPTKMVLSNNDLLMVMDGASSGDVYYVGQGIVGSTLSRVDCIDGNYISEFIYFIMKYYKDLIQSKNTGSAIPHTDKVFVGNLKVPKLLIEEQEKYKTLLYKILKNMNENKILEQLRDTLLPKIMNGEIKLDKIEI